MAKETFTAPWYPWYVRDVLTSERVDLLSLAEEGGYRRALDRAWMIGSVPANPKDCAAVIGNGCTPKIAGKVLTMFVSMPDRPDRMINVKLEKVREEQRKKYKKRSKAGKENAIKGWKQRASANGNGMPIARHSESDSSKEEIKNTYIPGANPEPVAFEYPIKNLVDAFPDYLPDRITPAMIGFIEAAVKPSDAEAWRRTIEIYQMNFNPLTKSYLPDKTANVLGVFRKQKTDIEREKNSNGNGKSNNAQVGKYILPADPLPAPDCGKCFDSGSIIAPNPNGGSMQINCPECVNVAVVA